MILLFVIVVIDQINNSGYLIFKISFGHLNHNKHCPSLRSNPVLQDMHDPFPSKLRHSTMHSPFAFGLYPI